jgi:hypothetical protein
MVPLEPVPKPTQVQFLNAQRRSFYQAIVILYTNTVFRYMNILLNTFFHLVNEAVISIFA